MSDGEKPARDAESERRLAEVVRNVLAPMIAIDGGEIEWVGVEGTIAFVRLRGACAGCPGQPYTTGFVILPALRAIEPALTTVRVKLDG